MGIVLTTTEELESVIINAIRRASTYKPQPQQLPDRCTFEDALGLTGLSKSKLYKLTSSKQIPHKTFGSRLVFSRSDLQAWVDSQTIDSDNSSANELALAKNARKRKGGTNNA